jgi:hypothetical protein
MLNRLFASSVNSLSYGLGLGLVGAKGRGEVNSLRLTFVRAQSVALVAFVRAAAT